jgi:hypothetical protein
VGPTATVSGVTSVLPWTFGAAVGLQTFRYDVTDANGTTAFDTLEVLVGAYAPDFKGQLYMTGSEVRFAMYPAASNPPGEYVEPGSDNVVNTAEYTIDRPLTGEAWAYYILADVPPLANPYVVHATYTDPTNGRQYMYTFSFDTTGLDAGGDWAQGDGSKGSGELPSWLNVFLTMIKDALKWLFVPTEAQMKSLMPGGSLGASLLDLTAWGTGDQTFDLHFHWGTNTVQFVSWDLSTFGTSGFASGVKLIVQAGYCLALVYMVVALI